MNKTLLSASAAIAILGGAAPSAMADQVITRTLSCPASAQGICSGAPQVAANTSKQCLLEWRLVGGTTQAAHLRAIGFYGWIGSWTNYTYQGGAASNMLPNGYVGENAYGLQVQTNQQALNRTAQIRFRLASGQGCEFRG